MDIRTQMLPAALPCQPPWQLENENPGDMLSKRLLPGFPRFAIMLIFQRLFFIINLQWNIS